MIDLMKRLSELDAKNPNVVSEAEGTVSCSSCGEKFKIAGQKDGFSHCKDHAGKKCLDESTDLEECGPMGMMGTDRTSTPATINMTAASGSELTGMLKDIMQLAGVHQVEPSHLGIEQEPMALTAEPMVSVEPVQGDSDTEVMRSVIDRMHTGDEEETDEGQYDNSPNDPRDVPEFDAEEFAHHENQPGAGFGRRTNQPNANPTAYESLMAEYKEFVAEAESKKKVSEVYGRRSSYYNPMDQERREQGQMDYEKRAFKRAELQHELGHEDDPDFERKMRQQQMDRDRGPWYIKIDGRILRSRGEIKVFDWRKGANNYALAILKNKPELQGKVKLTKSDEDDIMTDNN